MWVQHRSENSFSVLGAGDQTARDYHGVVQWDEQQQQNGEGRVDVWARVSRRLSKNVLPYQDQSPQKPGEVPQAKVRAIRGVLRESGGPCALQTEKLDGGCRLGYEEKPDRLRQWKTGVDSPLYLLGAAGTKQRFWETLVLKVVQGQQKNLNSFHH